MLENPRIRPVLAIPLSVCAVTIRTVRKTSRKDRSDPNWVVGFVDGEGCFSIGFVTATWPSRSPRLQDRLPSDAQLRSRARGAQRLVLSDELAHFFGVGGVSINRRHDNHKEAPLPLSSSTGGDELLEVIVPFFRAHPLRTAKAVDFELVRTMPRDLSLLASISTRAGLIEIAEVAETDESPEVSERADQNPQRPYAGHPRPLTRVKRWSHLHGDMQGAQHHARRCTVRLARTRAKEGY